MTGVPQVLSKSPLGPSEVDEQCQGCSSFVLFRAHLALPSLSSSCFVVGLAQTVSATPRSWSTTQLQPPRGSLQLQLMGTGSQVSQK